MVCSISSSPPFCSRSSPASVCQPSLSLLLLKSSTGTIVPNSEIDCEKTSLQIQAVRRNTIVSIGASSQTSALSLQYFSFVSVNYLKLIGEDEQFLLLCSILYAYRIECKTIRILFFIVRYIMLLYYLSKFHSI